ncbi:TonB-dependent siderophore receptor [Paraburkholderia sp. USG1]|uniref:TonB-dependent receptor n=1 Tax=Paraburkholderia sp. USG1 TaxID=2952268 RepID=UPI002864CC1A|nr:TonB-dependent siderophore receptor [Paraburkholderia sp. USG1]MDR8398346.1 TonB-dependent siderophore receptor [Paraburkholderia sp. USG1]
MRTIGTLRPVLTGVAASTSLAGGLFFVAGTEVEAQETAQPPQPADEPAQLPAIRVEGQAPTNALQTGTGLNRLPDDLQSTPQTVTVIPHVVIEQQQAATVEQVLQYVPGITVSTGEGNGGINGDQFRIRGFDASGDIYVDGLRDFGSYVRDSFATENVVVLKGPSSESFGNGTTGGVIELDSKKAHLGNESSFEATGGSGPYGRGVLDVNHQINDTTAVRVVGMGSGQDFVDRDHVYSSRAGVLASIGFGLGTSQTVTVNYFHQSSNQRPDFGVPMVNNGTDIGEPVTEYGVPRSTYYGRESDHDRQDADVASVLYKGRFGDWLTLTNDTRFGYYTRDVRFTPTFCTAACASSVLAGNLNTPYTIWQVGGTRQTSYGGENVTTAVMKFYTAGFRHELVAGVDVYSQHASTNFYLPVGPEPAGTLLNPVFQNSPGFSDVVLPAYRTTATSWDVGPFISDRVWLTPQVSILGGVRWDHYNVSGNSAGTPVGTTTNFASPKAALIWEPIEHQTYYFSYARSFTPPGNNITSLSSSLGLSQAPTTNLKPEGDTTYEIGGKWSLLDDRLGATAALFRVQKSNASYTDPTSGIQTTTDDRDRVQGVELGLTGKITSNWDVQAAYSYMDSKIVSSSISVFTPTSAAGNRVPYVSKHSASLWSTYNVTSLLHGPLPGLPGRILVGAGVNYRSDYYVDDAMKLRIPAATTVDAMVSYDVDRYHLALNVTNLTNALAYSSAFSNGYATPVAGRTVLATLGIKF